MKLVAVFTLFSGIAMLLQSSVDCKLCSPVAKDVQQFILGSKENYISIIKKYTDNQKIIENAEILKSCVDSTLTQEEKFAAFEFVKRVNQSILCR
uniref:Major allergen I polypeptide chain 1-like n=2 Tax=Monodelphis domestica TaxID=13616 RepID=A0A5F8H825_MONDO